MVDSQADPRSFTLNDVATQLQDSTEQNLKALKPGDMVGM
jgi:hypothetical protein